MEFEIYPSSPFLGQVTFSSKERDHLNKAMLTSLTMAATSKQTLDPTQANLYNNLLGPDRYRWKRFEFCARDVRHLLKAVDSLTSTLPPEQAASLGDFAGELAIAASIIEENSLDTSVTYFQLPDSPEELQ